MTSIDLNADLGEGGAFDAELMQCISSCNIACGGHAGDSDSMAATIALALTNGVAVGAHPSYNDREGFGRQSGFQQGNDLYMALFRQCESLADIAAALGAPITHLKPHGALYNDAAKDAALADIVARVTLEMPGICSLVGLPGSELQQAARRHGLDFIGEGFVDRAYDGTGALVSRTQAGAVYEDVDQMIAQALSLAIKREVTAFNGSNITASVDTLCIHGDTPGAGAAAKAIRLALEVAGVSIRRPRSK
ncbi:MAG: 5-oxoprolinase subunit PxpA [Woeseiaceae bacterium]|nr:5-oxoprolinase subunit PxpA [Woeseiaceae bacterium]